METTHLFEIRYLITELERVIIQYIQRGGNIEDLIEYINGFMETEGEG